MIIWRRTGNDHTGDCLDYLSDMDGLRYCMESPLRTEKKEMIERGLDNYELWIQIR